MAKQPSYEELEQRCRKLETKLKLLSDRQAASSKVDRETDAVQSSDDPDTVNLGQLAVDTLLDNIDDGIVMIDVQTKQLAVLNSAICQMLGYSKEELLALLKALSEIDPREYLQNLDASALDITTADELISLLSRQDIADKETTKLLEALLKGKLLIEKIEQARISSEAKPKSPADEEEQSFMNLLIYFVLGFVAIGVIILNFNRKKKKKIRR